jgi:hypothetical protein
MSVWAARSGFDEDSVFITMLAFYLQSVMGYLGVSICIRFLGPDAYPLVSGLLGFPLGYMAQHTSDRIIASRYGGVLIPNHATSFQLDAVRGAIYMIMLVPSCIAVAYAAPYIALVFSFVSATLGTQLAIVWFVVILGIIIGAIFTYVRRRKRQ